MKKIRNYADDWDEYVKNYSAYSKMEPTDKGRTGLVYPGDEWGTPKEWAAYADTFLKPYLPDDLSGVAVEIGQGSGKYTLQIIDNVKQVICFDVSKEFIKIAKERLSPYVEKGKVQFVLLEPWNCNEIINTLNQRNLLGKVALFFSVDSMVHVELHTLIAYFINAARALRIGGHMTMSVASCTNENGFQRLLYETPWCYGGMRPSHQFYFLSKDIVYFITKQLGFEVVLFDEQRDINFVAKKVKEVPIELEVINDFQSRYDALEIEREVLVRRINELQKKYEESEADRAARLEVIERQAREFGEKISEIEADRAARLQVIKDLSRNLQATFEVTKRQEDEIRKQHKELELIKSSLTWKMTEPFRWISAKLSRLF